MPEWNGLCSAQVKNDPSAKLTRSMRSRIRMQLIIYHGTENNLQQETESSILDVSLMKAPVHAEARYV